MDFHFRNLWEINRNPYLWTNETETNMGIERFSYFLPPVWNTTPDRVLSLEEVWEYISGRKTLQISRKDTQSGVLSGIGSLQDVTQKVRSLTPEEYGSRQTGKVTYLPLCTFGGVFSKREGDGLQETSGLVCLDIDHATSQGVSLEDLKGRLSQDREIGLRLLFTSPSGDGLKIVCKTSGEITDRDSYRREFDILNSFVSRKYSVQLDSQTSNIDRGCLLCFDPDAVLRTWTDTFDPDLHPLPEEEIRRPRKERRTTDSVSSWDWDTYREERLIPALFERIDSVFPEMSFRWRGSTWESPCKLDGSPAKDPRRDKSVITQRVPGVILEQGGDAVPIIDYYKDKNNLSFAEAMRELSRLAGLEEEYSELCRRYAQTSTKETDMDRYTTRGGISPQTDRETPQQTSQERYSGYLDIPDIREEVSRKKEGIKTGYSFRNSQGKEEKLILSPGLTFICGKSSHGKSRFLQNLSLQILQDLRNKEEEGVVLFFAFEEDYPEVILQFANIYTRTPGISKFESTSNTEVLRDYFKTGSLNKSPDVSPNKTQEENRQIRLRREGIISSIERFREIQTSGRLRVYYSPDLQVRGDRTPLDKEDLSGVLEYLSSKLRVKAVFLDYVQAIYKDGYRGDRKDELREICSELNKLSKRLDIPFVLSAQLNRETSNPTSMSGDNIAESADITRYSDTILCLWNSAFINDVKNKDSYLESKDYKLLQSRGFTLGEEGKLYCILTKNRGATPYIDAVLDFVGETGEIPTNEDLPPDTAPQTGRQKGTDGLFSGEYEEL